MVDRASVCDNVGAVKRLAVRAVYRTRKRGESKPPGALAEPIFITGFGLRT